MSNYRGMGKEKVVYTHNGIFFLRYEEQSWISEGTCFQGTCSLKTLIQPLGPTS